MRQFSILERVRRAVFSPTVVPTTRDTPPVSVVEPATPHASLAALGVHIQQRDIFGPIRRLVHIPQKTLRYTPNDKLYDAWIAILAGAKGIVEVNKLLRSDKALQRAFGREACAAQSVIQDTLDAVTQTNVKAMEQALDDIFRQHAQAYRHPYAADWQLLDVDMSGLPCGEKAALACHGYFGHQRKHQGRQLGRIVATRYDEIVTDRLYTGTTQLTTALQPLVEAAERSLDLNHARRRRTILRMDAGGGAIKDINWLLARGYQVHGKVFQHLVVGKFVASVVEWHTDPKVAGREIGYVTHAPTEYVRPVTLMAARRRRKNGQWRHDVIISTLSAEQVLALVGQPAERATDKVAVALAYVAFYDQRGGGVETAVKGDKQGLGLTKRNKKRFEAQQMLVYLASLAPNVLIWVRHWLTPHVPSLGRYAILRLVRDVCTITGRVAFAHDGRLARITLNQADPWSRRLAPALQALVGTDDLVIISGET